MGDGRFPRNYPAVDGPTEWPNTHDSQEYWASDQPRHYHSPLRVSHFGNDFDPQNEFQRGYRPPSPSTSNHWSQDDSYYEVNHAPQIPRYSDPHDPYPDDPGRWDAERAYFRDGPTPLLRERPPLKRPTEMIPSASTSFVDERRREWNASLSWDNPHEMTPRHLGNLPNLERRLSPAGLPRFEGVGPRSWDPEPGSYPTKAADRWIGSSRNASPRPFYGDGVLSVETHSTRPLRQPSPDYPGYVREPSLARSSAPGQFQNPSPYRNSPTRIYDAPRYHPASPSATQHKTPTLPQNDHEMRSRIPSVGRTQTGPKSYERPPGLIISDKPARSDLSPKYLGVRPPPFTPEHMRRPSNSSGGRDPRVSPGKAMVHDAFTPASTRTYAGDQNSPRRGHADEDAVLHTNGHNQTERRLDPSLRSAQHPSSLPTSRAPSSLGSMPPTPSRNSNAPSRHKSPTTPADPVQPFSGLVGDLDPMRLVDFEPAFEGMFTVSSDECPSSPPDEHLPLQSQFLPSPESVKAPELIVLPLSSAPSSPDLRVTTHISPKEPEPEVELPDAPSLLSLPSRPASPSPKPTISKSHINGHVESTDKETKPHSPAIEEDEIPTNSSTEAPEPIPRASLPPSSPSRQHETEPVSGETVQDASAPMEMEEIELLVSKVDFEAEETMKPATEPPIPEVILPEQLPKSPFKMDVEIVQPKFEMPLNKPKDVEMTEVSRPPSPCLLLETATAELPVPSPDPMPKSSPIVHDLLFPPPNISTSSAKRDIVAIKESSGLIQTLYSSPLSPTPANFERALRALVRNVGEFDLERCIQDNQTLQDETSTRHEPNVELRAETFDLEGLDSLEQHFAGLVRSSLVRQFKDQTQALQDKNDRLREEYKAKYASWRLHRQRLDRLGYVRSKKQAASVGFEDGASARASRRAITVGDAARSDLDMDQILASLANEDLTNPEILSRRNVAVIPDMLSVTDPKSLTMQYEDLNGMIDDPVTFSNSVRHLGQWSPAEEEIFLREYIATPKQFGKIAEHLPNKTAEHCVLYYYLSKKALDFKGIIAKQAPTKGKRGGRRSKQKGNALLTDLRQPRFEYEEESPASSPGPSKPGSDNDLGRSGRRPRAAAEDSASRTSRLAQSMRASTSSDEEIIVPGRKTQSRRAQDSGSGAISEPSDAPAPARKRKPAASHWTTVDKAEFLRLLSSHGKNWQLISTGLPSKTPMQVRNYFQNHSVELGLPAIAAKAAARKASSTSHGADQPRATGSTSNSKTNTNGKNPTSSDAASTSPPPKPSRTSKSFQSGSADDETSSAAPAKTPQARKPAQSSAKESHARQMPSAPLLIDEPPRLSLSHELKNPSPQQHNSSSSSEDERAGNSGSRVTSTTIRVVSAPKATNSFDRFPFSQPVAAPPTNPNWTPSVNSNVSSVQH